MNMTFSEDWFSHCIPNFQDLKQRYTKSIDSILEIGVFEGRSTCWMLENMLSDQGSITCIDPFASEISRPETFFSQSIPSHIGLERRFRDNIRIAKKTNQTVQLFVGLSYWILPNLLSQHLTYDFIYCDGEHASAVVLADAVMCYGLLKPGGILLFDDYEWENRQQLDYRPKTAIDSFVDIFRLNIQRLKLPNDYQLAIQRIN